MREKDTAIKRESSLILPGKLSEQGVEKAEFECTLCGKVAAHKKALCSPIKIDK